MEGVKAAQQFGVGTVVGINGDKRIGSDNASGTVGVDHRQLPGTGPVFSKHVGTGGRSWPWAKEGNPLTIVDTNNDSGQQWLR